MRRSPYGPERCDRCELVLTDADFRFIRKARLPSPLHFACLDHLGRTRAIVQMQGTRCLFCGQQMLLPELVDHFNARHGRSVVNW